MFSEWRRWGSCQETCSLTLTPRKDFYHDSMNHCYHNWMIINTRKDNFTKYIVRDIKITKDHYCHCTIIYIWSNFRYYLFLSLLLLLLLPLPGDRLGVRLCSRSFTSGVPSDSGVDERLGGGDGVRSNTSSFLSLSLIYLILALKNSKRPFFSQPWLKKVEFLLEA